MIPRSTVQEIHPFCLFLPAVLLEMINMIEALKSDDIVAKLGGRFKLTALIQRRLKELIVEGARPLIEREGRTDLELVIEEILQDKITFTMPETED